MSLRNSQIRLGLTEGPWSKLRKELQEAHESDDPPRKARSVLSGWVHHYGCALVYEGESAVRRLLNAAHDCGFHDVVHVDAIAQWILDSHDRWDELVAALECAAGDSVHAVAGDDDEGIVGVQAGAPLRHVFRPVTRTTPVREVAPLVRRG